jgi:hypothetical protein
MLLLCGCVCCLTIEIVVGARYPGGEWYCPGCGFFTDTQEYYRVTKTSNQIPAESAEPRIYDNASRAATRAHYYNHTGAEKSGTVASENRTAASLATDELPA